MAFHIKDHYYHRAKRESLLARSAYKLKEIDNKYHVLKMGQKILDLGYFPGSWIQYSLKKVGKNGLIVGLDIKDVNDYFDSIENVKLFQNDIFEIDSPKLLGVEGKFDTILSDMAPNTTGIKVVDQARSLELVENVFNILPSFLFVGGSLVLKVFDSNDAQVFLKKQVNKFKEFYFMKPKSTRSTSKEFFILAKGYFK